MKAKLEKDNVGRQENDQGLLFWNNELTEKKASGLPVVPFPRSLLWVFLKSLALPHLNFLIKEILLETKNNM